MLKRELEDHGEEQFQATKKLRDEEEGEDEDSEDGKTEKKAGRRKINIEFIEDKSRRHITFSKRKAGIMKKAYELSTLTGTQVLLLVASETGHVYTFATPKLQPLITKPEGKNLIQACLNSPDGVVAASEPSPPRNHQAALDQQSELPQEPTPEKHRQQPQQPLQSQQGQGYPANMLNYPGQVQGYAGMPVPGVPLPMSSNSMYPLGYPQYPVGNPQFASSVPSGYQNPGHKKN